MTFRRMRSKSSLAFSVNFRGFGDGEAKDVRESSSTIHIFFAAGAASHGPCGNSGPSELFRTRWLYMYGLANYM